MSKKEDNNELTDLTLEYLKKDNLKHRKSFGQYFTSKTIRERLLNQLPKDKPGLKILDPACGTGEFLITARKYFVNPKLYGWEIDKDLVQISKKNAPTSKISQVDSLLMSNDEKFDIIIGNPPYFEFSPSVDIRKEYSEIISGRINIFSLLFTRASIS